MNRKLAIVLFILAACVVMGIVGWQMVKPVPPVQPVKVSEPAPPPPPPAPIELVTPAEPQPTEEPAAPPAEPPAAPQEAAKPDPFGGKPITVETLTGCKEVQKFKEAEIVYEYAPNGDWKVNGNSRAKWTIEGNKVKIYKDGTDEVHYIDIVGNKLVYNGKECNMTR